MKKPSLKMSKDELKYLRNLIILALGINFIVEVLNTNSLLDTLSSILHRPHIFVYNAMIILVTVSVSFLVKRRIVLCSLISVIWIGFGITNNILLKFRVTPFTAVDLSLVSEAIPIADKYLTHFQILAIGVLVVAVVIALIIAFIKVPKHKAMMNYIANSILFVIILGSTLLLTSLGMRTNVLAKNFGNIADAFKDYGFAYCFTNSLINTGINKPRNYSEQTIQTIIDSTETIPSTDTSSDGNKPSEKPDSIESKTPNVIFLQLESFFDITNVIGLSFSSDPIPNFHKLQSEYTSGFLNVPSVGAGTANTEFEIITGMDLDFFGPGEYPYKTILKETTCESLAYNLKELGYSTHAIHNNTATFYGRNKVFANLGFDTFTSSEYMENISYNPLGWAKDEVLIEEIMKSLKSTKGSDYIYTISVQGHGKYPEDEHSLLNTEISDGADGDFSNGSNMTPNKNRVQNAAPLSDDEQLITVDGIASHRKYAVEYYVNQIHQMDQFVGALVEALEAYDEDVILVMYGDHLPSLGFEKEDLINKDIYQTQYIIWSSKDVIDGQHDRDIEAYQLSAYTMSLMNQNAGLLTKLHQQELSKDSSNEPEDSEAPKISYLDELKLLQYDMLYGKRECYEGENPYLPTDLQYGVKPITIDSVTKEDQVITIHGNHFTKASKVEVNGQIISSTYVDSNTITYKSNLLPRGTTICVAQYTDGDTFLSKSNEYTVE